MSSGSGFTGPPRSVGAGFVGAVAGSVMRVPGLLGIGLVWLYRLTLGALFPTTCKYHPSCSEYAVQALRRHGLVRGSLLAGWRLLRCNPWSRGGFDPVR
jgi:putative membrane protein insertion efficiency factor